MRRVVVTGLGMIAPTGNSVDECWQSAVAGKSGIGRITLFDPTDLPVQIAGEVKRLDVKDALDPKEANRVSRYVSLAAVAGREAVLNSGLKYQTENTTRWGCSIGVGLGGLNDIEENTKILEHKGPRRISPFFLPYTIPNMGAGVVSKYYNLKGPNMCTTTACTSGTHAIGEGYLYIKTGMADVMVAGGAESALSPLGISAFAVMKALCADNDTPETASRPFDKNRDGFVMGEGAGIVVIEELQHALKRGAKIYAELVGYGMSGDAHHITAPAPEGEGAERCMRMALESASAPLQEVDYINAHGTSTKLNDWYETMAIKRLFGDYARRVAVSSTKGVTGHCLGAAGGIEAVYSVLAVNKALMPPTANYKTPDPDCDLDYITQGAREKPIRYALSNSFGFGGTNGSLLFKRFES